MNSYTNISHDQPALTLEMLLETYARLQAMLPVVHYKTSKFLESKRNGKPVLYSVPTSVLSSNLFEIPRMDGPKTWMFHPDNLAYFQEQTKGKCILVKWPASQEATHE